MKGQGLCEMWAWGRAAGESGQESRLSKDWGKDESCTLPTGDHASMGKQARSQALSELGESWPPLFPMSHRNTDSGSALSGSNTSVSEAIPRPSSLWARTLSRGTSQDVFFRLFMSETHPLVRRILVLC